MVVYFTIKIIRIYVNKKLNNHIGIGSISEVLNNKNCIIYSNNVNGGVANALKIENNKLTDQALKDVENNYTWKIRAKNILSKIKMIN